MGSSPNWSYGYVPTAAQWNAVFSAKQDDLGYTPINRAGDTMLGRFVTFAATTDRAGFNIQTGVDPTSPVDGDIWVTTSGVFAQVNGATVGPIGPGSVTSVGLSAPSDFTVSGSPVTSSGSLTFAWATKSANLVLAGPATGANAAPTFRSLVGADLPNPTTSVKGGVKAYTAVTNQFVTSIGTDGTPASAQPSFSNISGQASSAQIASGVAVANLGYTPLNPANNLSDVSNPSAAAANIGAVSTVSPAFTGTPTAPTAAVGTSTTQLATTAFVATAISGAKKFAILQDQKASGTAGGATVGATWTATVLNTEVVDADNIVTLTSNTFVTTIDAIIRANASFYATGSAMLRLFNVTDSVVVAYGPSAGTSAGVTGSAGNAPLEAKIVAGKTYRIDYYVTTAQSTNGRGQATSNGVTEVYATAAIQGLVT